MATAYRDKHKPANPGSHVTSLALRIIGRRVDDAEVLIERFGLRYRTVMIDGKACPISRDHRPDRIGLTVTRGVVTDTYVG